MTGRIHRRALLRGLGGVAVSLPFLEAMTGRSTAHAQAQAQGAPKRFVVCSVGSSLGSGSTGLDVTYVPDKLGFDYDLKSALAPLALYDGVKSEISVVTGLRIPWAGMNGGVVPAGGRPNNHHETMVSPLLSGVRNPEGQNAKCFGPTSDQVVAEAIGQTTRFRSLAWGVQASVYLGATGVTNRGIISYKDGGGIGKAGIPVAPVLSPKAAFDTLFYNFGATDSAAEAAKRDFEWRTRRSILDKVLRQSQRLEQRLGSEDRLRMSRHFDEIRDLERRISEVPPAPEGACQKLPDPGPDPAVGGARSMDSNGDYPYTTDTGYSNEELRARVYTDLIHMALTCDLTRSISLMFTFFHSWMNMNELLGYKTDLHEMGHGGGGSGGGGTVNQAKALAWHYKHFAYLVAKLRDTPEGTGSVLDNTVLVVTHEGGYGLDPSDGAQRRSHSTENMACLIAGGRALGLKPGQHVAGNNRHPAQVLVSAMNAVGVAGGLGEVSGGIPELFQG